MTPTASNASLFDAIGGEDGITHMVDRFYAKVLADDKLKPYFSGVPMEKLRHMQYEFFAAALDGPIRYTGRPVIHAHHGRHITREHFQAFVDHLFETLQAYALTEDQRYAIIARINTYADDVVSSGSANDC